MVHKTCFEEGCTKHPSFNVEGATRLYCKTHKLQGMVDVKNKTCVEIDCDIRAYYNNEGESIGIYCKKHKKQDMIDVKSIKCIEVGCQFQPSYNNRDKKALYCKIHKKNDMVDVRSIKCFEDGCSTRANYNIKGAIRGLYCKIHKKPNMEDVINNRCQSDWCFTIVTNKKYDGYCLHCYINLFPDKPVSHNYKTKEFAVVEHIKSNFPNVDWIADKQVSNGCSRRRPDLLLDLGGQVLIVEVDENSHNTYDCSCENKRIMELSQDMGHRPIVFIRFNPDKYIKNGEIITSCWGVNKTGICVVKKSKEWDSRLDILCRQIDYWINPENITDKTVEIIQLYYDV